MINIFYILRRNIRSAYYAFYISYTKKSIWSNSVYIRRREFKAIQSSKRWSQRALFINQPRIIDGLRRQNGRGYARIVRSGEKRKGKKSRTEIHFWRSGIGTLSAVTGDRRRLRLLWRTISDGADVETAAGCPGRVGQCDIVIRLIRAGRRRWPVVRMAIKRGRAVHGVLHVNVYPKNVSASDRENSSSPLRLFFDRERWSRARLKES